MSSEVFLKIISQFNITEPIPFLVTGLVTRSVIEMIVGKLTLKTTNKKIEKPEILIESKRFHLRHCFLLGTSLISSIVIGISILTTFNIDSNIQHIPYFLNFIGFNIGLFLPELVNILKNTKTN